MTLLRCEDAAFGYEGKTAVRSLNFSVEAGDYIGVAGENGSGKSTLLRGLLGFLPPEAGRVSRAGLGPLDTGYLPQEAAAGRDFPASVYEVVLSGRLGRLGFKPFYSPQDKKAAWENLERLGIAALSRRCFRELSGGQQRRALLARALCAAGKLLLLDEPVAGLDPLVQEEVYALLARINREEGMAIIMVSHEIAGVLRYANRMLHIQRAQCFFGSPQEYRDSPWGRRFLNPGPELPALAGAPPPAPAGGRL
ncbi:MAG: metal ABC transporter ATP-binding protein [Treponema sp.]|jgi:zinc transport system ATP-binding protein|nr:metal ABC transporter ATP-binding protein [Treponema sp.]